MSNTTVLPYLVLLPTLLSWMILAVVDMRTMRVPRLHVIVGTAMQYLVFAGCAIAFDVPKLAVVPMLIAVSCAIGQLAVAAMRPGSLGLGDVTCTVLIGQAVGSLGWSAAFVWWCCMGMIGLVWAGLWRIADRDREQVPFVPVIGLAGVLAVVSVAIWTQPSSAHVFWMQHL